MRRPLHARRVVTAIASVTLAGAAAIAAPGQAGAAAPAPAATSHAALHAGALRPHHVGTALVPQSRGRGALAASPHSGKPTGYGNPDAGSGTRVPRPTLLDVTAGATPATTISAGFTGIAGTGWYPADTNAAPGVGDVVETVNESFAVYSRTGTNQYQTTFQNWFGSSGGAHGLFDPHVTFDPRAQRYALVVSDGTNWLLSVAQQTAGLGNWCNWTLSAVGAAGQFADFPEIGVDSRYIYLSMVDYASDGSNTVVDSRVEAIPRGQAESCQTVNPIYWNNLKDPGTSQWAFRISPATVYDNLDGYGWLADAYPGGGSHISVHYVDSGNSLHSYQISTMAYAEPTAAPQAGSSATIDTGVPQFTGITKVAGELYLSLDSSYTWSAGNTDGTVAWMQVHA